jgi:hypothetical protein
MHEEHLEGRTAREGMSRNASHRKKECLTVKPFSKEKGDSNFTYDKKGLLSLEG